MTIAHRNASRVSLGQGPRPRRYEILAKECLPGVPFPGENRRGEPHIQL